MKRLAAALFSLLALSVALPAAGADEPAWYEVELIVFRQWQAGGADAELNRADLPPLSASGSVSLGPPAPAQALTAYAQLSPSEYRLQGVEQVLKKSNSYQPLLHVAWRQPGLAEADAVAVALPSGWTPPPPESPTVAFGGLATPRAELPALYGLVKVYRERFIHAAVDLRYQRPGGHAEIRGADGQSLTEGAAAPAVNRQTRRMRSSGELHYLDHPTLGVLIQVTPIETAGGKSKP